LVPPPKQPAKRRTKSPRNLSAVRFLTTTARRDIKSGGTSDTLSTLIEWRSHETRHALSKQSRKLSGELQNESNDSNPTGAEAEPVVPLRARRATNQKPMKAIFMKTIQPLSDSNAPEDCPGSEFNPAPRVANGPAAGQSGPAPPAVSERTASRRSRFLEKVYYWVLSRS
jgi:hypothetical protein